MPDEKDIKQRPIKVSKKLFIARILKGFLTGIRLEPSWQRVESVRGVQ